jgi:hypothetical protein
MIKIDEKLPVAEVISFECDTEIGVIVFEVDGNGRKKYPHYASKTGRNFSIALEPGKVYRVSVCTL